MSDLIRVGGFDPAFKNWGVVIADIAVEDFSVYPVSLHLIQTAPEGTKKVRKSSDDLRRAKELRTQVWRLVKDCALIISEVPSGSQSARASFTLGIATGVLAAFPKPLIEVSPIETKLAAVGTKTASKREMIDWATKLHPELPWLTRKFKGEIQFIDANEHLADGLGVIHAGVQSEQFYQAAAMMTSMRKSRAA